jgi:Tol biopolymer transport system component
MNEMRLGRPIAVVGFGTAVLTWLAVLAINDRKAAAADAWPVSESKHLKNIKQLTHDFVRAGEGYFSPDMSKIIFQAEESGANPFYQIFVMDLKTGSFRKVSPGVGRTTCAYFRPDGKKIIFASSHLDPDAKKQHAAEIMKREADKKEGRRRNYQWDFDPFMDIFEANPDGSELKQITNAKGYDAEGAYSTDGSKIAFCSNRNGHLELYVMDSDGSNVRQLTNAPGCYNGGPFISPDGKRVIFRSDRKKKDQLQIYVINVDGSGEQALTDTNGVNWGPYWYRDSKHIIYAAADHSDPMMRPNYDLWWMNVDTGKKERISFAPGSDVLPVFSPDGKKLMWTSTRDGRQPAQLYIADFVPPTE